MWKVYIIYYLRPRNFIRQLLMIAVLAYICHLTFFPNDYGVYGPISLFIFVMIILGWFFYLYTLRPLLPIRKFVRNLTPAEKEAFTDSVSRYKPNMKFWDSGRFWITKSLTAADAGKVVWIHPVMNGNKQEVLIHQYGSPFTFLENNLVNTLAKPLIPISFPANAEEQIIQHVLKYNPDALVGYTKENVDKINRKYGTRFYYPPGDFVGLINDINDLFDKRNVSSENIGDFISTFSAARGFQATPPADGGPSGFPFLDFEITKKEAADGCVKNFPFTYTCDVCNGTGDKIYRGLPRFCRDCNGTGKIQKFQNTIFGTVTVGSSKVCKTCKGRGLIVEYPCDPCKGTGKLHTSVDIRIPLGTHDGDIITVNPPGGRDLKIKIVIQQDVKM